MPDFKLFEKCCETIYHFLPLHKYLLTLCRSFTWNPNKHLSLVKNTLSRRLCTWSIHCSNWDYQISAWLCDFSMVGKTAGDKLVRFIWNDISVKECCTMLSTLNVIVNMLRQKVWKCSCFDSCPQMWSCWESRCSYNCNNHLEDIAMF